ncbi:MAG: YHS domain-containing protein [Nitrospinota bacterium]
MVFIFRIVALLFLIWVVVRLLKSVAEKWLTKILSPPSGHTAQIAEMIKDPVCGSYVSMEHAVTAEFSGERKYFCSDKCLNDYRDKHGG